MPNPSLGLGVWGPLQPASDCLWCRNICIGLQIAAGVALMARTSPPGRSKWASRAVRAASVVSGSYLVLMAGLEGSRYILRSDPWYSDAVVARQKDPPTSIYDVWFGPKGYTPVSTEEFVRRARNKSKLMQSPELVEKMALAMRLANRKTSSRVLDEIKTGRFNPPMNPSSLDIIILDSETDDELLEFKDVNHWAHIEAILPLSMAILPVSAFNVPTVESENSGETELSSDPEIKLVEVIPEVSL